MATSDGGVILPEGVGGIPLDPADPRKGTITPVMKATELTAAVLQALGQTSALQEGMLGLAANLRDALAEAAELLEQVALVITFVQDRRDGELPDDVDTALEALRTYVEGRREQKALAEAAYQEWLAQQPVEGHEVDVRERPAEDDPSDGA